MRSAVVHAPPCHPYKIHCGGAVLTSRVQVPAAAATMPPPTLANVGPVPASIHASTREPDAVCIAVAAKPNARHSQVIAITDVSPAVLDSTLALIYHLKCDRSIGSESFVSMTIVQWRAFTKVWCAQQ